jgi:hypothetical protein
METLILGFVLGLLAGPAIRSWIVWREYRAASREAWLAEETLRRLGAEGATPGEGVERDARHTPGP